MFDAIKVFHLHNVSSIGLFKKRKVFVIYSLSDCNV